MTNSRDDEVVPFAHAALYAQKLPRATVREFDGRGHQFGEDLSEVARDIGGLWRRIRGEGAFDGRHRTES